jgi:uncharacterized protein YfkK (UPF0435 family)
VKPFEQDAKDLRALADNVSARENWSLQEEACCIDGMPYPRKMGTTEIRSIASRMRAIARELERLQLRIP